MAGHASPKTAHSCVAYVCNSPDLANTCNCRAVWTQTTRDQGAHETNKFVEMGRS